MEIRRSRVAGTVRTEGGLLPSDLLEKIRAADSDVPGLKDADFVLPAGERAREATTRSWNRLVGSWAALEAVRVGAYANDPMVGPTRDRLLVPLFEELGFGRLPVARAVEIDGTSYPISHNWDGRVPVHLVGYGVELDTRTKGVRGAAGAAPHALLQEYLNRADEALWGVVSNGRTLRLLRDSTSLTRQAYVEFDLEAIFAGELYADFALLWFVLHRTRFEGERPADCLLERWTKKAADDGTRALDKLQGGVEKAIETLGAGFLATRGNAALVEALRSGGLEAQDYYRELLRLVYRLIFLFTAEDRRDEETGRELLLDPAAPEEASDRYRRYYSTVRLRSFAGRRRGSRHPDLWVGLRRVIAALGSDGAPSLGLPALGSFLFGREACPHLDASELTNEDLLQSVRALATIEEDRRLRLVDYRNLGAEELGGIYEGLLELHPKIELDANPPRFSLSTAAGNERRSTGSYYTPTSLISCLLDSALDPVVDEATRGKSGPEAEAAILGVSVVDPAAGSGHFLIAAAHRLAKRLAAARSGEGEPPPAHTRRALRDVIARCIYAVDINPMAVELCKVSLWLEALEPGRPLSFLDAHIKCGNSLLGTTPELAAAGIPEAAFEAISGDDKAVARDWRRINAGERAGQYSLFGAGVVDPIAPLAAAARAVEELPEDSSASVVAKAARHEAHIGSATRIRAKATLDAWCAAFVVPKAHGAPAVTTATIQSFAAGGAGVHAATREQVQRIAAEYGLFHWPLEFPSVFERGGFDVVLGNPPWERIKLQEKEYFAERSPAVAGARNAAERKVMIVAIEAEDPLLWASFQAALRRSDGESHLLRDSARYPLTGRGDINTYAVFAELMRSITHTQGRMGVIVPTGIATDETTRFFFGDVVERRALVSLYSFENEEKVFAGVHNEFKFCLLTLGQSGRVEAADLAFFLRRVDDITDQDRHFALTPSDFQLLNPNTRTSPTFRNRADAELAKSIYRRVPAIVREREQGGDPWRLEVRTRFFHMAEDSALFSTSPGTSLVPLYEGKMIHQYDHRYGTYKGQSEAQRNKGVLPQTSDDEKAQASFACEPQYWVAAAEIETRLGSAWKRNWFIGLRDITNSVSIRTVVATALPRAGAANTLQLILSSDATFPLLLTNLNAVVLDWVARQKQSGVHLQFHVLKQLPLLPPTVYRSGVSWLEGAFGDWLRRYAVELAVTSDDLQGFGHDLGWLGAPFRWDADRRRVLRAELDAAFAHLYGISRSELERVFDSFWIVRDSDVRLTGTYRSQELTLDAYDEMVVATPTRPFVSRLSPAPGDPLAAHSPPPGEDAGHWILWTDVLAQAAQAAPSAPSVRTSALSPATPGLASTTRLVPDPPPSLFALDPAAAWQPEAAIAPSEIVMGARVRHRAKGEGTVLSVRPSGKSTELLIRFDATSEAWIAFGYGVLEFHL
jgi:hypothetical protein